MARWFIERAPALDPFAIIKPHDPRFVDIERDLPREHFGVSAPVRRMFGDPNRIPGQVKFGILGHRGTGKSTLIRKAMDELRPLGIMPVMVDALTSFADAELGKALTIRADVMTMEGEGELDRARTLLREEVLPIFEQVHDESGMAATLDRLADNALMRGDLLEALDLRRRQREVVVRLADAQALGGERPKARGDPDRARRAR